MAEQATNRLRAISARGSSSTRTGESPGRSPPAISIATLDQILTDQAVRACKTPRIREQVCEPLAIRPTVPISAILPKKPDLRLELNHAKPVPEIFPILPRYTGGTKERGIPNVWLPEKQEKRVGGRQRRPPTRQFTDRVTAAVPPCELRRSSPTTGHVLKSRGLPNIPPPPLPPVPPFRGPRRFGA